jgi:hypothetical protein
MARSNCIYIVLRPGQLPAAFTVRYELVLWLGRQEDLKGAEIYRCDDGSHKQREPRLVTGEMLSLVAH